MQDRRLGSQGDATFRVDKANFKVVVVLCSPGGHGREEIISREN